MFSIYTMLGFKIAAYCCLNIFHIYNGMWFFLYVHNMIPCSLSLQHFVTKESCWRSYGCIPCHGTSRALGSWVPPYEDVTPWWWLEWQVQIPLHRCLARFSSRSGKVMDRIGCDALTKDPTRDNRGQEIGHHWKRVQSFLQKARHRPSHSKDWFSHFWAEGTQWDLEQSLHYQQFHALHGRVLQGSCWANSTWWAATGLWL